MTGTGPPTPADDFDARLRALKKRGAEKSGGGEARGDTAGLGTGLKVAVDLLAGVVVGVGIGYALDRWLGTSPWFTVAMLFLGFAAGILNVYRAAQELERRERAENEPGNDAAGNDKTTKA
jgi:ATP synthase protein I